MTDDRVPADEPTDMRDQPRAMPATPPVIEVRPAEAPAAEAADRTDIRPIDSSLLGEGGLPAANRAEGDAEVEAQDAPVAADAPDPGPTTAGDGPPPRLTPAPPPPPARRGGFWPLVLGGVLAAGLGSAATIWALPNLSTRPAPLAPAVDEATVSAAAASAAQEAVAAQRDSLLTAARDAGAEAARAVVADAPAAAASADPEVLSQVQDRVAALEALADRVAALEARPAAAAPDAGGAAAPDAIASLRSELAAQAQRLQDLAARPQADPAMLERVQALADAAQAAQQRIADAATAAEQRLTAVEQGAAAVETRVAEAARRAEALAAVGTLQSALYGGGDRAAAVEGLAAAGVEAPAALAAPTPSLEELQQGFPEAARAALRSVPAGTGNAIANFFRAQTGARSIEPREGTDPDAVLSRAGAAVDRGEIDVALIELEALPAAGREAMGDWLRGAEAWAAASAALGQIEGNLK